VSELLEVDRLVDIQKVIAENPLVLLEAGAAWCMPCQRFLPHFKRFAAKHPGVVCVKVDVDVDPAVVSEFKLQSVPQVMFFVNGQLDHTLPATARTVQKLEQELLSHL